MKKQNKLQLAVNLARTVTAKNKFSIELQKTLVRTFVKYPITQN